MIQTYVCTFLIQLIGSSCVALVAIIIYVGIIDRIGRRLPICITYTVLTAVLFIIGGLFYNKSQATQRVLVCQHA